MTLLLMGAKVLTADGLVLTDIRIEGATVVEMGVIASSPSDEVIDCEAMVVSPGFVDLHTHLREPPGGSESILSGSKAAALGGYTAVCAMPNTNPPCDSVEAAEAVRLKGREAGFLHVEPIGSITKARAGHEVSQLTEMVRSGVTLFSDDGDAVPTAQLMLRAMQVAADLGATLIEHAEDGSMRTGHMHYGDVSGSLGVGGIPAEAEEICVLRDLVLARMTKAKLHIAHITSAGAVEAVRRAKEQGINVTCEVTPHHVALTDQAVAGLDPAFKVAPPLRDEFHVEALKRGCADGTIDVIATDHAPHPIEEKQKTFESAPCGMLGLQTAFSVCMDQLVAGGYVTLERLLEMMSVTPARIAGLAGHGQYIAIGASANLVVIDTSASWTFDANSIVSGGARNTPFDNRKMLGRVIHTIFKGRFTVRDAELQEQGS